MRRKHPVVYRMLVGALWSAVTTFFFVSIQTSFHKNYMHKSHANYFSIHGPHFLITTGLVVTLFVLGIIFGAIIGWLCENKSKMILHQKRSKYSLGMSAACAIGFLMMMTAVELCLQDILFKSHPAINLLKYNIAVTVISILVGLVVWYFVHEDHYRATDDTKDDEDDEDSLVRTFSNSDDISIASDDSASTTTLSWAESLQEWMKTLKTLHIHPSSKNNTNKIGTSCCHHNELYDEHTNTYTPPLF